MTASTTAPPALSADGPTTSRPARLGPGPALVGAVVLAGAMLVASMIGPASLDPYGVIAELLNRLPLITLDSGLSDTQSTILWQIRMPRVVLGALVGAALSTSGAAYQGVFRNPLADPYLLGAAAGAGLGATLAIVTGVDSGGLGLPLAAFLGAVVGVLGAYTLGASAGRSSASIILAGVAVASFLTAVQTFVQQQNADTLREVYAWVLGRLSTAGWHEVRLILPYVAISLTVMLLHGRLLDVLSVGGMESESLGVNTARVRILVVGAATLATAAAVAVSGLIGFVGIIVPHTIRLILGSSYRQILPLSMAFGAAFLVLADVLARSLLSPQELPIGIVTAFFGAPFFAVVLRTSRRSLS